MLTIKSISCIIFIFQGKSSFDARNEVLSGVSALEWYAEEAKRVFGLYIPSLSSHSRRQLIAQQPIGVVGVITPVIRSCFLFVVLFYPPNPSCLCELVITRYYSHFYMKLV